MLPLAAATACWKSAPPTTEPEVVAKSEAQFHRGATPRAAGQLPRRAHPATVALTAAAAVLVSVVASRPSPSDVERSLFVALNGLPAVVGVVLVPVMHAGGLLAGPVSAAIASIARRRQLAIELLLAGPLAWFLARGLKVLVARPRPAEIAELVEQVIIRGGSVPGLGYPSGHAAVAAALATVAAAWLPWRWAIALWTLAALVGIARIFVGAHLPLDVVGGMLLGGLIGTGVRTLFSLARLRNLFVEARV